MVFFKIMVVFAACLAQGLTAPQFTAATTTGFNRQLGLSSISGHTKTVDNAHSHVHRTDSRIFNPARIVRRRGPITRVLSHSNQDLVSNLGSSAGLRFAAPTQQQQTVTAAASTSPSIFQSADGRFFALSDGNSQIDTNQIFQTEDGRFFRVALADDSADNASAVIQEDDVIEEDSFSVVEAARIAGARRAAIARRNQLAQEEEDAIVVEDVVVEEPTPVAAPSRVRSQASNNQAFSNENVAFSNVNAAFNNGNAQNNLNSFFISAPLTNANARFVGVSPGQTQFVNVPSSNNNAQTIFTNQVSPFRTILNQGNAFPAQSHVVHQSNNPNTLRAISHVTQPFTHVNSLRSSNSPLGYSLADASTSSGYYFYDNAGIAYQF